MGQPQVNAHYYDPFRHLLFCEKTWYAPQPYGEMGDGWAGANVYCVSSRQSSVTLSPVNAAATFGQCLGFTATHELGHCVKADHTRTLKKALMLTLSPLGTGESVWAQRFPSHVLTLDSDVAHTNSCDFPLLSSDSDTFGELAAGINALRGYSATAVNDSGGCYSFTIPCDSNYGDGQWVVRNPEQLSFFFNFAGYRKRGGMGRKN
jgi:hypothetical protein